MQMGSIARFLIAASLINMMGKVPHRLPGRDPIANWLSVAARQDGQTTYCFHHLLFCAKVFQKSLLEISLAGADLKRAAGVS